LTQAARTCSFRASMKPPRAVEGGCLRGLIRLRQRSADRVVPVRCQARTRPLGRPHANMRGSGLPRVRQAQRFLTVARQRPVNGLAGPGPLQQFLVQSCGCSVTPRLQRRYDNPWHHSGRQKSVRRTAISSCVRCGEFRPKPRPHRAASLSDAYRKQTGRSERPGPQIAEIPGFGRSARRGRYPIGHAPLRAGPAFPPQSTLTRRANHRPI
jgi:hypothetical protein